VRSANPSQSNNDEVAKLKAELAAVAHHDEVEKLKAELTAVNAKNKERARDHLLAAIAVHHSVVYVHAMVFIFKFKYTFCGMFEGLGLQPCLCVPASLTTKIWVRIALSACLSHLQAELRIKLSCLNAHSRMLKKHLSTCLDLSCAHLIPGLRIALFIFAGFRIPLSSSCSS
jgi:hypothetical protein